MRLVTRRTTTSPGYENAAEALTHTSHDGRGLASRMQATQGHRFGLGPHQPAPPKRRPPARRIEGTAPCDWRQPFSSIWQPIRRSCRDAPLLKPFTGPVGCGPGWTGGKLKATRCPQPLKRLCAALLWLRTSIHLPQLLCELAALPLASRQTGTGSG